MTEIASCAPRQDRLGDTWFLDEVFVTINGQRQYLWRAVDQDGDLIDILVQPRRDGRAARRFFRRLLKSQRQEPVRLVTDKLGSYRVAHRDRMPLVTHDTRRYANNRAEVSHQPTRQRDRQMRGFTSSDHAQRFLHVHGVIQNLFRVGRHLLRAAHHRMLRARSFTVWAQVTAASCDRAGSSVGHNLWPLIRIKGDPVVSHKVTRVPRPRTVHLTSDDLCHILISR